MLRPFQNGADPGPVLVVSLNPALDKTVEVSRLQVGKLNRVKVAGLEVAGKGINVAKMLQVLACPVRVIGFVGGRNADIVEEQIARREIPYQFVMARGETRVNLKVLDLQESVVTELNEPGLCVDAEAVERFLELFRRDLTFASFVVLSGSLPEGVPADFYGQLIRLSQQAGKPVFLDAEGEALRHGLAAEPFLVKPNQAEADSLLGGAGAYAEALDGCGEQAAALARRLARPRTAVVVSLGARGALAIPSGAAAGGEVLAWCLRAPQVQAANVVGAGDALVAGLVHAFRRQLGSESGRAQPDLLAHPGSVLQAARFGVAVGTALVLTRSRQARWPVTLAEMPDLPALEAQIQPEPVPLGRP